MSTCYGLIHSSIISWTKDMKFFIVGYYDFSEQT